MDIKDSRIDSGKAFDWGKTSEAYAKYRDIYPEEFYQKVADRGLCIKGQRVLDLGTGTGVLPRNMYKFGAEWVGTDISPEQIEQAKILSESAGMNIDFRAVSAEKIDFPSESFDVLTACQCFWYFDHDKVAPEFSRILKKDGKLVVLSHIPPAQLVVYLSPSKGAFTASPKRAVSQACYWSALQGGTF